VVYRPSLLPDPAATATRWRTWCRLNNIGEIYLAYTQSFELNNPAEYGFDAAIEFSPMNSAPPRAGAPIVPFAQNPHAHIYDWRVFKERAKRIEWPSYTYFRGVNPSWDNTPRRRINSPTIFLHSSPQVYGEWLDEVATATIGHYKDPSERLVFINAWNEWAEGAHLEPDRRYGYAWLQATRDALANASRYSGEIVDVTPNKHPDLFSRRWAQIEEIFGAALDRDRYSFLTDYSALLDQLVKDCDGASSFFNTDGIPCCSLSDGSEIRLVSRRSLTLLTSAYPALSGSHGPVCFVILQYNKPQITMECVRALKAVTANDDNVHIIIVDNGSEKENEELITRRFASDCQVSVLTTGANLGFAQGNNVGYRFARESLGASFIVVLNNDVVIRTSDFISQMLALYQDWSYSILGPDIVTPDGRRENPYNDWIYSEKEWADLLKSYEERREQYLAGGGADFTKFGRATPSHSLIANPILQGAIFIASPIFVNRHDEMFDPRTFLYGEEFLLAARALHDGDLLLYSNELQVAHEEGCTTADLADHRKILLGYDNPIAAVRMILEAGTRSATVRRGRLCEHYGCPVIHVVVSHRQDGTFC
jgi:GT2 family glycosyltransferase